MLPAAPYISFVVVSLPDACRRLLSDAKAFCLTFDRVSAPRHSLPFYVLVLITAQPSDLLNGIKNELTGWCTGRAVEIFYKALCLTAGSLPSQSQSPTDFGCQVDVVTACTIVTCVLSLSFDDWLTICRSEEDGRIRSEGSGDQSGRRGFQEPIVAPNYC